MKKILIITSEYPNPFDKYDTPVVHYYAKEWVKMGHNVNVIHYRSTFPYIFYFIAKYFSKIIKKLFKTDFIPVQRLNKPVNHVIDEVPISMVPLLKNIPHTRYGKKIIKSEVLRIKKHNENNDFIPDLIIGHFVNPQIEIIPVLKKIYPTSISSIVLHENIEAIHKRFNNSRLLFESFDKIGFRYKAQSEIFQKKYGSVKPYFICPSGVPASYLISDKFVKKFNSKILKISFVGMLIPLKNIDIIIKSLYEAFPEREFEFTIIGDGMLEDNLKFLSVKLGLSNNIKFKGRMQRGEVQDHLNECDIFVMVSAPEAFGLVYLEAMSKGCIVIGAKNQGIDGVIIDGQNGFLCIAGNTESLVKKFKVIKNLSKVDLKIISDAARATVKKYTDEKVAIMYLQNLIDGEVIS